MQAFEYPCYFITLLNYYNEILLFRIQKNGTDIM